MRVAFRLVQPREAGYPHRNWPCSRATQNTEKIPPLHVRPLALDEASYRLKRAL